MRRTGLLADLGDKRRSYYQLGEPLARLAFQLKESRGRPVALVVDFLKAWFDHEGFSNQVEHSPLVDLYQGAAIESIITDAALAVAKAIAGYGHPGPLTLPTHSRVSIRPDSTAQVNSDAAALLLDLDDAIVAFERVTPNHCCGSRRRSHT